MYIGREYRTEESERSEKRKQNMIKENAMLSIFGRAGAILLAVVDVSHALFA